MAKISDYFKFGISPSMLHPLSFEDELEHLAAVDACCSYDEYESIETFLPDDPHIRKLEIQKLQLAGKTLHYNTPVQFQMDGPANAGSDDPAERASALCAVKMHLDYAAQAQAPLFVVTGCPDKGPKNRPMLMARFEEYFYKTAEYARQFNIQVVLEPIERESFKKLLLGPTGECVMFIQKMQSMGCQNAKLMLDSAHLPLMGEQFSEALAISLGTLVHIHLGDAVLDPDSPFYGHTHPPIGVQGGTFDVEHLSEQLWLLFQHGYLSPTPPLATRPSISLEMRPYPGVSERTSARFAYEKVNAALNIALTKLCI